jgi:hypothetical protein
MTLADISLFALAFIITENVSSADSSTQISTFLHSRSENLDSADLSVQQSVFVQTRVESFTIADLAEATGWFKINNSQTPNWVPIDTQQ